MNLAKLKENFLVRAVYNLPGAASLYHFLWALFGAIFYRFPSKYIFVIGITGTKGKTTTLELLSAILEAAGKKTATLSSLQIKIGGESEKNRFDNTMPGRFYLQRFLRRAVRAGCQYALIEVTSQGVVLHRHRFINWNAGVLTNFHPEHIEAHGGFEKYRKAKLSFLKYILRRGGKIFINREDENYGFFDNALYGRHTAYSQKDKDVIDVFPKDLPMRFAADNDRGFIFSDFNKDNIAAAAAVAINMGIEKKIIADAIGQFRGVPGRMEFIKRGGITVVVDYAHTPDSLRKVYYFLRESNSKFKIQNSKLICVLGSAGGGRDKWKRPEMGKIAAEYCDEIILTEDDSYDEQPEAIIAEIKSGVTSDTEPLRYGAGKRQGTREILDRREAIFKAVELAREGDVVVCAGYGSQEFMHVAHGRKIPWNEKAVVEEALSQKFRYSK